MIRIILIGNGRMGKRIEAMIREADDMSLCRVIDPLLLEEAFDFQGGDVIIDFSHPDNLEKIVRGIEARPLPLIIATTGYSLNQEEEIRQLSQRIPLFYASNFSIGISLMKRLIVEMKKSLGEDFDIELIEKHHNIKADSPSGTALSLVAALDPENEYKKVHGREGMEKRGKEIGVHAIRGGTIAGEHTVIFAGAHEILEITHKAESPNIFAAGALRAAKFIVDKGPGLYGMEML